MAIQNQTHQPPTHARQNPSPQPALDGARADLPAGDQARGPAVPTSRPGGDPFGDLMRQSRDTSARAVRLWSELAHWVSPLALVPQRPDEHIVPAKAAVDGAYELVEKLLDSQRRWVDHILANHRQVAGLCLEAAVAAAGPRMARAVADRAAD